MHACMLSCFSCVQLCVTLWTAAHQATPSTGFSRQEYWSGLPFPSPRVSFPQCKPHHTLPLTQKPSIAPHFPQDIQSQLTAKTQPQRGSSPPPTQHFRHMGLLTGSCPKHCLECSFPSCLPAIVHGNTSSSTKYPQNQNNPPLLRPRPPSLQATPQILPGAPPHHPDCEQRWVFFLSCPNLPSLGPALGLVLERPQQLSLEPTEGKAPSSPRPKTGLGRGKGGGANGPS